MFGLALVLMLSVQGAPYGSRVVRPRQFDLRDETAQDFPVGVVFEVLLEVGVEEQGPSSEVEQSGEESRDAEGSEHERGRSDRDDEAAATAGSCACGREQGQSFLRIDEGFRGLHGYSH